MLIILMLLSWRKSEQCRPLLLPTSRAGSPPKGEACGIRCYGYNNGMRRLNLHSSFNDQARSCRTAPYRSKQKAPKEETLSEIEPVMSSIAQGPAKNMIKID